MSRLEVRLACDISLKKMAILQTVHKNHTEVKQKVVKKKKQSKLRMMVVCVCVKFAFSYKGFLMKKNSSVVIE